MPGGLGSPQGVECSSLDVEPGPHATTPPFFQAPIAKSSQPNLHRHKTTLREPDTHRESVSARLRNKDVCIR